MPNDIPTDLHDLDPQNTLVPDFEQSSPNDLTSEYAKVPAETYFAQSPETIVYVDMVQNALEPIGHDRPSILTSLFKLVTGAWMLMSVPGVRHEEMKTQGSMSWESSSCWPAQSRASTCGDFKLLSDVWFWSLMTFTAS